MSQVLIPTTNGVLYIYGARPPRDENIPAVIHNQDNAQTLEVFFDYSNLPTPGTDAGYMAGTGIPANAIITSAYYLVLVAFAGGTSYNIGLAQVDGTSISTNGLWSALPLANIDDIGNAAISAGSLIGTQIVVEGFPVVAATGTFTSGLMQLQVTYIPPLTAPNE